MLVKTHNIGDKRSEEHQLTTNAYKMKIFYFFISILIYTETFSQSRNNFIPKKGECFFYSGSITITDNINDIKKKYHIKEYQVCILDVVKNDEFILIKYSASLDNLFSEHYPQIYKEPFSLLFNKNIVFKVFHRCSYDSAKKWLLSKKFQYQTIQEIKNYSDGRVFLEPFFDFSEKENVSNHLSKETENKQYIFDKLVFNKSYKKIEKYFRDTGNNLREQNLYSFIQPYSCLSYKGSLSAWGKFYLLNLKKVGSRL